MAGSQNTQSVLKRLRSELLTLMSDTPAGISAFPDGENMLAWSAKISGADGTVYEGLEYSLRLVFPLDYPFTPPRVEFVSPCFHPNVDQHGNICLDILRESWSACYSVKTILLSVQSLLGDPNNESPLNGLAAALWSRPEEYRKKVLDHRPKH